MRSNDAHNVTDTKICRESLNRPSRCPLNRLRVRLHFCLSPLAFLSPTLVSKLGSFSTPGFGKVKPKPLDLHATDNDTPYINISSTESTPLNASTSSIPIKRFSSGSSEDFPPLASTKRPKITHQPPDKENLFLEVGARDKGKGRAREPLPSSPLHVVAPSRTAPQASNVATNALTSASNAPKSMGKLFETMPHDIDLYEV